MIGITVLVPSPFTGTSPFINSATVVTVNEVDPVPGNSTGTAATTLGPSASDLSITKSALGSTMSGSVLTYTLVVTNSGPSQSVGAQMTDTLPSGETFISASSGCVFASGIVTCTLGTLASGATAALNITVRIAAPYVGPQPISNSATVTAVNEGDPVPTNNTASASTLVVDIVPAVDPWLLLVLALGLVWFARRHLALRR